MLRSHSCSAGLKAATPGDCSSVIERKSLKMKDLKTGLESLLGGAALLVILGAQVFAQELPKGITEEDLANNNQDLP
jgi:hypothetical protein